MKKARIRGAEVAYEVAGRGPAILFLHAYPLGLAMWDEPAEALAAAHQVVRFDCRGFGGSPPGDGLLTMEGIADDAAALLEHLGVSQAVVCGCSMGGYAAFAMVRRHPERLCGLVLVDTRAGADSAEARKSRALLAERVLREGSSVAAEAALPKLLGETTHRDRPQVVERVRRMILANAPRGIADALAGLGARADSAPTLREIRVPTLVVCGAEDVLTPVAEAEALRQGIAGSRLEVLPAAGHLSSLEVPVDFQRVLSDFLASGGAAGGPA